MSTIYQAQTRELKQFKNLFIELTAKNCNKRCKNCYIDFPFSKQVKDFISLDKIKEALNDTTNEDIQCIYLTGAEPMTHPEFNSIVRLCLKRTNVCICTNGSFINEKKARFFKKIENESNFEIIFQLSIDHYNEIKNDDIRGRGAYREVLCAVKHLYKYGFNPILCITNHYNENKNLLISEFQKVFERIGFMTEKYNFKINKPYNKNSEFEEYTEPANLDCEYGRILTNKGVYSCPFLANDHRAWNGSNFKDFSPKNCLETNCCSICLKNKNLMFSINFDLFKN